MEEARHYCLLCEILHTSWGSMIFVLFHLLPSCFHVLLMGNSIESLDHDSAHHCVLVSFLSNMFMTKPYDPCDRQGCGRKPPKYGLTPFDFTKVKNSP
mmetsp:Transcript_9175/g.12756  ORF Transcript_9175/g.12756 Transcript_9175/m.12756 type:complete len:98 (+) Transcript_9175:380-673(+)